MKRLFFIASILFATVCSYGQWRYTVDQTSHIMKIEGFFEEEGPKADWSDTPYWRGSPNGFIGFRDIDEYSCVLAYEPLTHLEGDKFRKLMLYKRLESGWKEVSDVLYYGFSEKDTVFEYFPWTIQHDGTSYIWRMNDDVIVIFLTIYQGKEHPAIEYYYNDIIFLIRNGDKFDYTIFTPLNRSTYIPELIPNSQRMEGNTVIFKLKDGRELSFTIDDGDVSYGGKGDVSFKIRKSHEGNPFH